jgi:hypothetical protein
MTVCLKVRVWEMGSEAAHFPNPRRTKIVIPRVHSNFFEHNEVMTGSTKNQISKTK